MFVYTFLMMLQCTFYSATVQTICFLSRMHFFLSAYSNPKQEECHFDCIKICDVFYA